MPNIRDAADEKYLNVVVTALEMPDGTMVTGRSSRRMVAGGAAVLNWRKKLAGIDDDKYVIAPNVFGDIQSLKRRHPQSRQNQLKPGRDVDCPLHFSGDQPVRKKTFEMLSKLKGCKAHCTAILSDRDEQTLRSMGIDVTCDPEYLTTNLYFA